MKFSTKSIKIGVEESDPSFGSVVPPIYPSSTFRFPSAEEGAARFAFKSPGMIYSRLANPTVQALEKRLTAMEGAEAALVTSSGMSAILTAILHFAKAGDHIVAHKSIYGGTFELLSKILPKFGIKTSFVDFTDPANVEKTIKKNTTILYFESPTNPLMEIVDIKTICYIAKKHNLLTLFDNTFANPPLQYPLKLGVDVVLYSLTKYINGHSDVIAGAIISSKKIIEDIFKRTLIFFGPTLSPFSAYLILRGMTTLNERMKKHCENALAVAKFLEKHPKIERVYYPGLKSHPHYKLAKKQMNGFGGVLSFEVKGGYEAGKKLVNSVKIINLAVSLGAVESLIEHPASMTHSELSAEERKKAGIKDGLIRLSVGLEDVDDIIQDLSQALDKV